MPLVRVREDETLENALRRFKRKCEKSGILSEVKKRQHYLKPSQKRKTKAVITSYSIHYTKLYESCRLRMSARSDSGGVKPGDDEP